MRNRNTARQLAGACLIAAPLALTAAMALAPWFVADTGDLLTALAADESALLVADLLVVAAVVLLIPASLGVLHVLRNRAGRLAPVAVGLFLVGWLFVLGPVMVDRVQLQLATSGMPRDEAVALVARLEADAGISVIFGVFIIGHTVGAILLGFALGRTRFIPLWAAGSVVIAAVLHPIARVGLGSKWLDVVAFALLALGLGVTGVRVLRMTDDEWEPRLDALEPPVTRDERELVPSGFA